MARMQWMDFLRGAAVLLVVLVHSSQHHETAPAIVQLVNELVAPFRMPALLFASGVLLPRSLRKKTSEYVWGKVRGLAWPWFLWGLVMLRVVGISNIDSHAWWFIGGTHTWFLSALFLLYLAGIAARRVPPWMLAAASLVLSQLLEQVPSSPGVDYAARVAWHGTFFFAGAVLSGRITSTKFPRWVLPIAAAAGITWALYNRAVPGAEGIFVLGAIGVLAGIVAICLIAQLLPRVAPVRLVEWYGRNSIVVYLIDWPVHGVLTYVPLHLEGWVGILVPMAISLGVSTTAILLRPWTSWLYQWPAKRPARQLTQVP